MSDEKKGELLALADRCEVATVPDRDLDKAIELVLPAYEDAKHLACGVPAYTASLDAAMMLIPKTEMGLGTIIELADGFIPKVTIYDMEGGGFRWVAIAKPAARALCAAALRARAAA